MKHDSRFVEKKTKPIDLVLSFLLVAFFLMLFIALVWTALEVGH